MWNKVPIHPHSNRSPSDPGAPTFDTSRPHRLSLCPQPIPSSNSSSHDSILARWRSSRRREDLFTTTIRIRRLLKLCSSGLLTAVVALICSVSSLSLVLPSRLSLLVAIPILRLLQILLRVRVLVLRIVGGGTMAWWRVAHPPSAVERLQTPFTTTTCCKTADGGLTKCESGRDTATYLNRKKMRIRAMTMTAKRTHLPQLLHVLLQL